MANSSWFVFISVIALAITGCARQATEPAEPTGEAAHADHDHAAHGDHDDAGLSDMDKMKAELAKLSPEDAESAMKQHFCPVSSEMLGTMGSPIKVDVKGQQVWICCEGCRDKLLADPDNYLAKLAN